MALDDKKMNKARGAAALKTGAALSVGVSLLLAGPIAAHAAASTDAPIPVSAGSTGEDAVTWAPDLSKNVLGAKLQDGPNADKSVEGLGVWPGQSAKYQIMVDRDAPAFTDANGAERAISGFSVSDQLPDGMKADLRSLTVFDPAAGADGNNLVAGEDYKVAVSKDNVLTVTFSKAWIASNVGEDLNQRVSVVFNATLAEDAKAYSAQENHASQTLSLAGVDKDGVLLPGADAEADTFTFATQEPATVLVPGVAPVEAVFALTDEGTAGAEVEDKVIVGGDSVMQEVTLDGTFAEDEALALAYDIKKFGIVDDFDEAVYSVDKDDVRVLDASGNDATDKFNVTVKSGKVTVLAKAKNGAVPVALFGQDYKVQYVSTVKANIDADAMATGTTVQVIDGKEHAVGEETSVTVKAIHPQKTVVSENGDRAAVETVASGSEFWYRVVSSEHPANALYPVESWSAFDQLTQGDQQLHDAWSVRAVGDILDEKGKTLFKDGDVIASNEKRSDWFLLDFSGDAWAAEASDAFLETVSAQGGDTASSQWELFVSATRTADEGTRTSNTGHEERNWVQRSVSVTTGTDAPIVVETPEPTEPPVEVIPEPTEPPVVEPPVDPKDPKPEPTEEPTEKPSEEPTVDPTEDPKETPAPSEDPKESEAPTEDPKESETPEATETPAPSPTDDGNGTESPAPTKDADDSTKAPVADVDDKDSDKDGDSDKDSVVPVVNNTDSDSKTEKPKAVSENSVDSKADAEDPKRVAKTDALANTGADGTTVMGIIAGGLLAVGGGFMFLKNRMTRRHAGADEVSSDQ